jgi:DNA processing protein
MQGDLPFWVAFSRIPGVGRARFQLLERHFGSLAEAWEAPAAELLAAGLDQRTVAAIVQRRGRISPQQEMERLQRQGVQALTWHDPAYPPLLKEIYDLPPVLYLRGELTEQDQVALAVVGTRRPTAYGRQAAEELTWGLARAGITIISGLARGIDAIAHRAALEAGGRTIAVLACGLDLVYPPEHARLAREVMERGALLSDYPLGTVPRADYFPRRNRIMAGLGLGVLVVEGDMTSGALNTARWAVEQDREVFAVPGSIFSPQSRGPHWLLQQGAKLVQGVEDVLEELNLTLVPHQTPPAPAAPNGDAEAQVLRHMGREPRHVDEVCRLSGLPIATVSSALAMLELKGLVKQVGIMTYVRAHSLPAGGR